VRYFNPQAIVDVLTFRAAWNEAIRVLGRNPQCAGGL
jgi:hypothetical protein